MQKTLSVFIDESGDFGDFSPNSPYYLVSMVFHDQSIDISKDISILDRHIQEIRFPPHAIHMGPLIRRESIYGRYDESSRAALISTMYHFTRRLNIQYICPYIRKTSDQDYFNMFESLSRVISEHLQSQADYLNSFDKIIIYYDNCQHELTKILTSVFSILSSNIEFRRVVPSDYKLFQVADLICTWELLALKASEGGFTKSEKEFFGSPTKFLKNRYKLIVRKKL